MNILSTIKANMDRGTLHLLIIFGVMILPAACKKNLDSPLNSVSNASRDSSGNIRTVLAASSYTLFDRAFTRAALDSPFAFYTVFAPSDAAMTAAGLTSAVIDALPIDSLYKIVGYHLTTGILGDSALASDTITTRVLSLRQDVTYDASLTPQVYPQYLYINKKGGLYINGLLASNSGQPLHASNGNVYPIDHVLAGPSQNLWTIIQSRPELSLYVAAYRILDSFASTRFIPGMIYDTTYFTDVWYTPANPNILPPLILTTVLAPTNTAFANAGFATEDVIRLYIVNSPAGSYDAMDSVLKAHYFLNPGQSLSFYQDWLSSPVINNGYWNTNPFWQMAYQQNPLAIPFYTNFSGNNGVVNIQWSRKSSISPLSLPYNTGDTYMANNGVLYETDQLFYPQN